jgi:hypothetical protein
MAPMKKRSEKKGGKKKEMIRWKLRMDLHCQQQQEVMEIWSEEKEKKMRPPSLQMRLDRRQKQVSLDRFLVKVAQKEKESTDSSDSVSDNESRPTP